jgi:hypothetical protein
VYFPLFVIFFPFFVVSSFVNLYLLEMRHVNAAAAELFFSSSSSSSSS